MSNLSFSGECPYCNHIFTVRADSDDIEQKTAKQICPDCNKMCLIKADSDDYILAAEQSIPASKTKQQSSQYEEPPKEQTSHSPPDDSDESFSFFEILSFVSIVLVGIFLISTFSAFFSDNLSLELIYNKVFNAFSGGIGSIIFAVILGGGVGLVATAIISAITGSEHNNVSNLFGALIVCLYFFTPENNPSTVIEPAINQEQTISHPPSNSRCAGDCENGQGTYTWDDGSSHSGGWLMGEKHGYGISIWSNGDKYEGEWLVGDQHGQGSITWPDGSSYKGKWENNIKQGQGIYTWPNGEEYQGDWFNGDHHGYGVYSWPNGSRYAGQWRDGEKHGSGIYTWEDGDKESGEWRNGERID